MEWQARLEIDILNGSEDCLGDESIVDVQYNLGLEENDYLAVAKDRGLLARGEWLGKDWSMWVVARWTILGTQERPHHGQARPALEHTSL